MLGTPPAFILSQDQTLNKLYLNRIKVLLKSILKLTSSQKKLIKLSFRQPKTLFWCLFSISFVFLHCSIFKVLPAFASRRQLLHITTARSVCQHFFHFLLKIFSLTRCCIIRFLQIGFPQHLSICLVFSQSFPTISKNFFWNSFFNSRIISGYYSSGKYIFLIFLVHVYNRF